MLVGVKYCGGCNPNYDRKKEVEKLRQKITELRIEPVCEKKEYDKIFLVCGCSRVCLNKYCNIEQEKYILFQSREDFDDIEKEYSQEYL